MTRSSKENPQTANEHTYSHKKNAQSIREAARLIGVNEKEILERAVLFYLESVKATLDLEKEFRAWEELSDEAFGLMEKRLRSKL